MITNPTNFVSLQLKMSNSIRLFLFIYFRHSRKSLAQEFFLCIRFHTTRKAACVMSTEDDGTKEHKQMRSTLASIVRVVARNRKNITQNHVEAMKKTPFYLLFNAVYNNKFDFTDCRQLGCKTSDIVSCFRVKSKKFVIGGQELSITRNDVKYIFGIVDGKKPIELSKWGRRSNWKFCNRVLGNVNELKQKIVKERLTSILNREKELPDDVDDVVRLFCLLLISTLFFSITGVTISWGWVKYVEDLDEMRKYDWSQAILTTLLESIAEKKDNPYKILGCTALISYWLCEHTRLVKPKRALEAIPRLVKWNLSTLCSVINREMLRGLNSDQVIFGDVQPTNAELRMYETLNVLTTPKVENLCVDVGKNAEVVVERSFVDDSFVKISESQLEVKCATLEGKIVKLELENEQLRKKIVALEGELLLYADLHNKLETKKMELCSSEEGMKEKELKLWSMTGMLRTKTIQLSDLEENYQLKVKEVEMLKNLVSEVEKVSLEQKEQIKNQANEIKGLEDRLYVIEVEPAVHAVTQAFSAPNNVIDTDDNKKQNSMVKRIKEKQRKAAFVDDYEYGDRKKQRKQKNVEEHQEKGKIPAQSKTFVGSSKFLSMLDSKYDQHCGNMLSTACLEVLVNKRSGETVYFDPNSNVLVTVGDVMDILKGVYISSCVVDAFSHQLLKKHNESGKFIILDSNCWTHIVKDRSLVLINQVVQAAIHTNGVILMPMLSTGCDKEKEAYHWTLLVFDLENKEWRFYNSLSSGNNDSDEFLENADEMKIILEDAMYEFAQQSNLVEKQYGYIPLISMQNIPHQGTTNDCAVFVCYFMHRLLMGKNVPKQLRKDRLLSFKAYMIESIVTSL